MRLKADAFLGPGHSMLICLVAIGVTALAMWRFSFSVNLVVCFAILEGAGRTAS